MAILLPLFLGIVQVGLTLHVRNVLASAASEGARRGAVYGGTPQEGWAKASDQITTALGPDTGVTPRWEPANIQGIPAVRLVLSAQIPALGFGPAISVSAYGEAVREAEPVKATP